MFKKFSNFPRNFWLLGSIALLLVICGFVFPEALKNITISLNQWIYRYFGNYYLWMTSLTLLSFIGIGLSPLGSIRLGGINAAPQFSRLSWLSMLFCAGMGTGLMFWGAAEPLYHFENPPLTGIETFSDKLTLAFHYTFFHWGLHPWAIYGMSALAIAFFGMNCNRGFCFSAFLFENADSHSLKKHIKTLIKTLTLVAIMFGVTATFGMGVLQISGGLSSLFHLQESAGLTISLVIILMLIYIGSAMLGIQKGIQVLSNINFVLYIVLLAVILWLSPILPMIQTVIQSLPHFIERIPAMSLGLGTFRDPSWPAEWTVKYWSWWMAWAPFVGIFIASISKGRSVRELVVGAMLIPTLFSIIWFTVFGNAAISLQQATDFAGVHVSLENVNLILFGMIKQLHGGAALAGLTLFMIALDFVNSADAATYSMAQLSIGLFEDHPPQLLCLAWGIIFAVLTAAFLFSGGIQILQEITLITTLPFSIVLAIVFPVLIYRMWQETKKPAH